jgi:alpha-D-xyloside xylohydrolase
MKFNNGYWRIRDGVTALFPLRAHSVDTANSALTAYALTRPTHHRGDTLNAPLLTLEARALAPDVIKVRLVHFDGEQPPTPAFELATSEVDAKTERLDDSVVLRAGDLELRVTTGDTWSVEFAGGGRRLTGTSPRSTAFLTEDGKHYVREQLDLAVEEHVYGLGERFGPLVRNGQVVDIWNADGGTNSEQAYKNIPFYLTDQGYGVLVDNPGHVSFEVGSEVMSRVGFSVEGQALEYVVIYGPTPKEILRKYTALTGRPALPPAWSFGTWLSTSFTTDYDEATVTSFVEGFAERDLPLSVVHFDCFWMREFHWSDFIWDPATFPDPAAMLARLKERGLKICVWINPYIAQRSVLFAEGRDKGYLLKRPTGHVHQVDDWQAGMALVDFTNPDACAWFGGKLKALLDMGVDAFKTDFGERVPTDVAYFDGSDPERMHNYYTHLYNKTVYDLLVAERGEGEAVLFARSATVGGQQFPVHWGGDCESSFEAMSESLRGGLSLSASGFGFWSHDIGGFEGTPEPEIFKRWVAFGLLSSHSRLHGSASYRVPWAFDEESVDVLRYFTKLKYRLMPYLYGAAVTAHREGIPVLRAMAMEFPEDPATAYLDKQYMLGDSLLVAPVFHPDGLVRYYVPAGTWTHLLTGDTVHGPGWREETHGPFSLPLLVRPGSVLGWGAVDDRPDYEYADGVTLRVFAPVDGSEVETVVPSTTGGAAAAFTTRCAGSSATVTRISGAHAWSAQLGGDEPRRADNESVALTPSGRTLDT